MPRLHVVQADRIDGDPDEPRFDRPPPRARPSDRLEPWPSSAAARKALAHAAREQCVAFETAAVVVVERSLLDDEFARRGLAPLTPVLDEAARAAKVEVALAEPQRAYLRALYPSRNSAAPNTMPAPVVLPMRLTDRVASATLEACLRAELLDSALAWERAAVAAGLTMSEWAAWAALDAVASRR
jgi:hypothetical protein